MHIEPQSGVIEANGIQTIQVFFAPKLEKKYNIRLHCHYGTSFTENINATHIRKSTITVIGRAARPDFPDAAEQIDFVTFCFIKGQYSCSSCY